MLRGREEISSIQECRALKDYPTYVSQGGCDPASPNLPPDTYSPYRCRVPQVVLVWMNVYYVPNDKAPHSLRTYLLELP